MLIKRADVLETYTEITIWIRTEELIIIYSTHDPDESFQSHVDLS